MNHHPATRITATRGKRTNDDGLTADQNPPDGGGFCNSVPLALFIVEETRVDEAEEVCETVVGVA